MLWNDLEKTEETNAQSAPEDLETVINGVAFLIQRRNDINNVICQRVYNSPLNIKETFCEFVGFCRRNKIQYIRVEGNTKRYERLLKKISELIPGTDVVKAMAESFQLKRNVFYIKLY